MTTREEVLKIHKENPRLSYADIGRFTAVSRQRVHQIIHNYSTIKPYTYKAYYCSQCSHCHSFTSKAGISHMEFRRTDLPTTNS